MKTNDIDSFLSLVRRSHNTGAIQLRRENLFLIKKFFNDRQFISSEKSERVIMNVNQSEEEREP